MCLQFDAILLNKYLPNKITAWFNKYTQNGIEFSNKFTTIMFILVSIILILTKLGSLYVSAELYNNIDDYVQVYNHIKNITKSSLLIIVLKNNLINKNKLNVENKNSFKINFYQIDFSNFF